MQSALRQQSQMESTYLPDWAGFKLRQRSRSRGAKCVNGLTVNVNSLSAWALIFSFALILSHGKINAAAAFLFLLHFCMTPTLGQSSTACASRSATLQNVDAVRTAFGLEFLALPNVGAVAVAVAVVYLGWLVS